MRKILIYGKLNGPIKEIHSYLSKYFQVQLCSENPQALSGMIQIVEPDLILISLIGLYDVDKSVFRRIGFDYPKIPVLTIGTENEKEDFLKYYENEQFENLIRPVEARTVYEAVCERFGIRPDPAENPFKPSEPVRPLVLVVDDNAGTLRSIMGMLKDCYDVMLATSGMQAMTQIGKNRPDVILLDYEMPVCDGRQTLEMIRAEHNWASIPVIFLTSVNDREHIEAVVKLNPSGYLLKPPVQEILMDAIEKALQP